MKIGELKDIINGIDPMLDDMTIHDGNEYLGAPEVDIELNIMDYLGHRYCDISVEVKGDTGREEWRFFTNIKAIATHIANGEKIRAIKEMRTQFSDLSLRESKAYIDRYLPFYKCAHCTVVGFDYDKAAAKFIADHSTIFLSPDEFKTE